jgi:hypothetical protein
MAVKIIANELFRKALEILAPRIGIESGVLVNIEEVEKGGFDPDKISDRPIIFLCFRPESWLQYDNHTAAQYFYRSDCAYFALPGKLNELKSLYDRLVKGEKPENKAAILASNLSHKKNSVSTILHDLNHYPGEVGQKAVKRAEAEFGFVGSPAEIQKMLEAYREDFSSGAIKTLVGDKIISGVFCDVEGTLIIQEKINQPLVDELEKISKTKAVSIWTGGDVKEATRTLFSLHVEKWPVLSKYDFAGCMVETIFDDLPQNEFENNYDIYSADYRQIARSRP